MTGCPPSAVRPYPAPTAQALLAHLQTRGAAVAGLRARAKADYLDQGNRVKVTIAALAGRPDRLRIAAENALTGPLLTLATDGQGFQLLDVRQNRFLQGPVSPCNIARLIRADLQAQEVVEVLLGGVALLAAAQPGPVAWDPAGGGREVLTLRDSAGRTETVWLSARDRKWDVVQAELRDPAGAVLWRIRHEGFEEFSANLQDSSAAAGAGASQLPRAAPGLRLPQETFIEDPAHHSDVRLRWRERELNPDLPPAVFHLDPPPGLQVEAAACHD